MHIIKRVIPVLAAAGFGFAALAGPAVVAGATAGTQQASPSIYYHADGNGATPDIYYHA